MATPVESTTAKRPRILPPLPRAERAEAESLANVPAGARFALWQLLRDVKLWGECPADARDGLLRRVTTQRQEWNRQAAEAVPELAGPLEVLACLQRFPHFGERARVAEACRQIVAWADGQHHMEAAREFAEAAAIADPECPQSAADAGQMCSRLADAPRAMAWYQRAVVLAVRRKDWEWYVRSYARLGFLRFQRGEYEPAHSSLLKAARVANHTGRRAASAAVYSDLMAVSAEMGNFIAAEAYAKQALILYPVRHFRLPRLAHDYAWLLMQQHYYALALALLESSLPYFREAPVRMMGLSHIAHAAAIMCDNARSQTATAEVLRMQNVVVEFSSAALLRLAHSAHSLCEWDVAESRAAQALDLAIQRNEGGVQRHALRLLDDIMVRAPAARNRTPPEAAQRERIKQMIRELSARMRKCRAPDQ